MKRIGIAVKTTEGGRWIVPQIVEARRRGMHVTVMLPEGRGRLVDLVESMAAKDSAVELLRAPVELRLRGISSIRRLFELRRLVKALDLDAILYHLYATALAIRLSTVGLRIRRVHMVAGPLYLESALIRLVELFIARLDDAIVCGSLYTRQKYEKLGVPHRRLHVIPYGVDVVAFIPPSSETCFSERAQLHYGQEEFLAVMVAYVYAPKRLVFEGKGIKGHEDLLSAWTVFHERHSDASLLMVGGGFDEAGENYRKSLIENVPFGLASHGIRWLDSVDDVRSAYSAADISVSPSLSDNHGAALEASAMGVMCIVSDAGALPEAVAEGAGWIYPAGSPQLLLERLESAYEQAKSEGLRDGGRRARAYIEANFSQQDSARRAIDVLVDTGEELYR